MTKLDGMITLIAGGAGNVGEGIVRVFLKEGATVIVPARSQDKLDQLWETLGDLASDRFIPLVGNIGQVEGAESIRDQILNRFGRLDAVVASLGGAITQFLPLVQVPMEMWNEFLENNLTSHFVLARTFIPVLAKLPTSSYTLLGGSAAEIPIPNFGAMAVPAAGQLMLTRLLIEEMKGTGVRINELLINSRVLTRSIAEHGQPEWITAQEIGEFTAYLASQEGSMVNGSILHLNQKALKNS